MTPFKRNNQGMNRDHELTMTVGELISRLQEYPADMPVTATWEGTIQAVKPECFSVSGDYFRCQCLVIDVENI